MSSTFLRRPAAKRSIALIGAGALAMGTFGFAVAPAHAAPVRADLSATCEGLTESPFTDIGAEPADTQEAISCLYNYDITQGLDDTTYGPRFEVTRQQMAIFIARQVGYVVANSDVEGPVSVPESDYSDRDELTAEGQDAVDLLTELGVVTGNADGTFDGERSITRGEMAVFINRVQNVIADQLGDDAAYDPDEADTVFNDVDPGAFYADAVYALQSVGIVQGTSTTDSTFSPDAPVLRNQMALFIMRHLDENIVDGRVETRAIDGDNEVFTNAPELVSVSDLEAEVVEFQFDETVTGQALERLDNGLYPDFRLYNSDGVVSYPSEARIEGDRVLARFTAAQVAGAAVASVRYNAVEDVTGVPSIEAGVGVQPSAAPSAEAYESQLTNVGNYAQGSVTNPDTGTVDITVDFTFGPGRGGVFGDDAATQYGLVAGGDATDFSLVLNNGTRFLGDRITEVVVDPATDITTVSVVVAADPTDVPESQIRRGVFDQEPADGTLVLAQTWESLDGNTTDPDLVSIERISDTQFRFTFDEAVSAAAGAIDPTKFTLYNELGFLGLTQATEAGRSTQAADNASVVVATFPLTPVSGTGAPVGAFVDAEAVVGTDNLGSDNLGFNQPDEEVLTTPVGPDAPPANITSLPDLVGIERDLNVVTENSSVTFVFDQSVADRLGRINYDLYDENGTQFRVTGSATAAVSADGTRVTFTVDDGGAFVNEQIVAAVTGGVEDTSDLAAPVITERQSGIED